MKTQNMKKVRFIGLGMVLCILMMLVVSLQFNSFSAFAATNEDNTPYSVESLSKELFGDLKIKSSEYLYNFDDSADFIYVDYEGYGYAVFFASTLELLEYSPKGSLPFLIQNQKSIIVDQQIISINQANILLI